MRYAIQIIAVFAAGLLFANQVEAQPDGYYDDAEGLLGEELREALHDIIDNHTVISYGDIWDAFFTTDVKPNGMIWDMYSDVPDGEPPYEYTPGSDQGGSAGGEGEGYNREHSWPRSWFGGEVLPMNTDIHMVVPSDIYCNSMRGSYPYGEVSNPGWTSENGSKRGDCSYPGYNGMVFEPIDEYKGDFARVYFYFTTRYYGEDGSWPGSDMCDGAVLEPWAEEMLLEWHESDPVSEKELDRNDAVYAIQDNRNPFIDNPDFVLRIYDPDAAVNEAAALPEGFSLNVFPNPFNPATSIRFSLHRQAHVRISVYNALGQEVAQLTDGVIAAGPHTVRQDAGNLVSGVYFLHVVADGDATVRRLVLLQ